MVQWEESALAYAKAFGYTGSKAVLSPDSADQATASYERAGGGINLKTVAHVAGPSNELAKAAEELSSTTGDLLIIGHQSWRFGAFPLGSHGKHGMLRVLRNRVRQVRRIRLQYVRNLQVPDRIRSYSANECGLRSGMHRHGEHGSAQSEPKFVIRLVWSGDRRHRCWCRGGSSRLGCAGLLSALRTRSTAETIQAAASETKTTDGDACLA